MKKDAQAQWIWDMVFSARETQGSYQMTLRTKYEFCFVFRSCRPETELRGN